MMFDVVIPMRNGEDHIIQCLESLSGQEGLARVIVIDDGSTDRSAALVKDLMKKNERIEIHSTRPRGLSAARNFGVFLSTSKYVAFLDSDDFWKPQKLGRHIEHISFHNECNFSFSYALEFDMDSRLVSFQGDNSGKIASVNNLLLQEFRIWGSASSVVVNRDTFNLLGGFDESLEYGEDWDLWIRLSEIQNPCTIEEPLTIIRNHKKSMQRMPRVGNKRFLSSQIYCLEWERHPFIFDDLRFRSKASEMLWGDFRKNFSVLMIVRGDFNKYLWSSFPQVCMKLKSPRHDNLMLTFFMRRVKHFLVNKIFRGLFSD